MKPGVSPPPGAARTRKLQGSEGVAIGALVALVMAEIAAFGASDVAVAAVFGALQALFLLVLLATCGWARRVPTILTSPWPGLLFLAVLIGAAWPLTPFGPGGPHPVWAYIGQSGGSITVDRSALILNLLRLIGLACLFNAAWIIGASETRRRALIWWLLLALGVFAALALVDNVTLRRGGRLAATLLSPNSAATLMGIGLVFALAFFSQAIQRAGGTLRLERLGLDASLALGAAGVFAVALTMTASRAGLFSSVIALAVLLTWQVLAQGRKVRVMAIIGGAAALLVVVGVAMRSADLAAARLENLGNDMASRQIIFDAHWQAFLGSPWFGFGLGSFPTVNQLITTSETLNVLYDVRATHNLYLQWLEEGGIIAAALMAVWMLAALWRAAQEGLKSGTSGAMARATIAASLLVLLHGLSDFAAQVPALQALFAVGLGAVTAVPPSGRAPATIKWGGFAFAGIVLTVSVLFSAPLAVSRFGGDMAWIPTASADVLAASVEKGLARETNDPAAEKQMLVRAQQELAMRPASGGAWLRLAAVQFQRGDVAAANIALDRSFSVAPLQTSLFQSRTRLAYEHWGVLTPAVRQQVMYQARVEFGRSGGPKRLIALANSIRDPAGRVGLAFLIVAERAKLQQAQAAQ
jgi:O-antigen ligase